MRRHSIISVIFLIITFTTVTFAHYGARFEPLDGTLYHGCGWNYRESVRLYSEMFSDDHHPLVLQVNTGLPGTRDTSVDRVIGAMTNPIFHPDSQYIEYSLHFTRGNDIMLDSVFALTDELDNYIDTLAIAFNRVDRPFFLRIGFEFNGAWNPYHPFIYPLAFRKLVEELRERGVDNFATVWCYEADAPSDFADSTDEGWKWYPGDDVVDWFGLDPFDVAGFDPDLPDSSNRGERRNITKKGKTELFLRFARERRKPVFLNEFSAVRIAITSDEEDEDSTDGRNDWETFFMPFFQFLENHPEIKGLNYINIDWTLIDRYRQLGWQDSRLEINSYIRNRWVAELINDRYLNAGYDITQEVSVADETTPLPQNPSLSFYPNPFNSALTVNFMVNYDGLTTICLLDLNGREVCVLWDQHTAAGLHSLILNASNLPSGIYMIQLRSPHEIRLEKVVLIR